MQLLELLLGDLDLLQARLDLRERQEASLLTLGDQRTQLVQLRDRSFVGSTAPFPFAHGP